MDRNPRSLAVMAGMKKTNGHAEPTKSNAKKKKSKLEQSFLKNMQRNISVEKQQNISRF